MNVKDRLIAGLAKKDADTLQKFVLKVLDMGMSYWGPEANKAMSESNTLGTHDKEADVAEVTYNHAFRQWHLLAQTRNNVIAWLDPTRRLPDGDKAVEGEDK